MSEADRRGGEDAHEVVLQREVEAGHPGVALAPGAAAQLVVYAPRFVALRPQHVEAARLDDLPLLLSQAFPPRLLQDISVIPRR